MQKRTLNLVLPWPPSLNRIWRAYGQRVILSSDARAYKKAAANALPVRVDPLTGRLVVTLKLCPPVKLRNKAHDIANREKVLFDTLTEQRVWLDDSQIDSLLIVRGPPSEAGHVDVLISEY